MRGAIVVLALAPVLAATAAKASELNGVWARGDGQARVRIAPCGSNVCATNVWVSDPSSGEAVGDRLVMTLAKQPNGSLSGTAFDQKRNLNISMTVRVSQNSLNTRGCLVGQMICKDMSWTAVR